MTAKGRVDAEPDAKPSSGRTWLSVASLVLIVATVAQMGWVVIDFTAPRARQYWTIRELSGWERSALLSEGRDFLDYVRFLRSAIPESGKVVLPPHSYVGRAGPYTYVTFIQYFLFPRQILNCGDDVTECVRSLTGSSSYLVRIGRFPPPDEASKYKVYIPFNEDKGLYVPK